MGLVLLALLIALALATLALWRGLPARVGRDAAREALIGSAVVGAIGGAVVAFLMYALLTMDSRTLSLVTMATIVAIGVDAAVYFAVVTAAVYAVLARIAGSSRRVLLFGLLAGPIVGAGAYLALFSSAR